MTALWQSKEQLNFKEDEAPKVLADEVLDIDTAIERGFTQHSHNGYNGSRGKNYGTKLMAAVPQQKTEASEPTRQPAGMVKLRIPADMDEAMTLEEIKVNLKRHEGDHEVLIYLPSGKMFRTEESLWVSPSEELRKQMAAILRMENVKNVTKCRLKNIRFSE